MQKSVCSEHNQQKTSIQSTAVKLPHLGGNEKNMLQRKTGPRHWGSTGTVRSRSREALQLTCFYPRTMACPSTDQGAPRGPNPKETPVYAPGTPALMSSAELCVTQKMKTTQTDNKGRHSHNHDLKLTVSMCMNLTKLSYTRGESLRGRDVLSSPPPPNESKF
jgi:hypothetical protein